MWHTRLTPWMIVTLLVALAAPTPRLVGAMLATRDAAESPIGGKPLELRGRNRIGDLPVARCITDQAPRRDSRRRGRPTFARLAPTNAAPLPHPGGPTSAAHVAIHLRC